jgi:O-antigen/teichoic acid export membrane protein
MISLLRQFGKNVVSGWASLGIRFLLVFLINPILVHSLGNDRYGVWALIFSIINYMTVFDFGLQGALVRFISKYLGIGDYKKINAILNTGFFIYSAVGLVVIIISFILSFFVLDWFKIPAAHLTDARIVLFIMGLKVAMNFVMYSWGGSLGAFHRFDISNGLTIAEDILRSIAIIILLKNGYGLIPLALVFLISSGLRMGLTAVILKKLHPAVKFSFRLCDRSTFREIFNYSAVAFLISMAWLLIANSDNLIIAYFLNMSSVTTYAIAATFLTAIRSVVHSISIPLRPLVSHYETINKRERIARLYIKGTQYIYFLSFMIAGITLVYGDSFIRLWMGEEYGQAAVILKILIVPAAIYLPQLIGDALLYGIERHKYILYLTLAEGVTNLTLSLILVHSFGIVGVAIGTIIPQVLIYLFGYPFIIKKQLGLHLGRYYLNILSAMAISMAVSFGLAAAVTRIMPPNGWLPFFLGIAIIAAITVLSGYFLMNKDDKKDILNGIIFKARTD